MRSTSPISRNNGLKALPQQPQSLNLKCGVSQGGNFLHSRSPSIGSFKSGSGVHKVPLSVKRSAATSGTRKHNVSVKRRPED